MTRRDILGRRTTVMTVVSAALLIAAIALPRAALSAPGAPSMTDARAEAVRGGYRLIDFGELRGRLEQEPGRILLVDTRQDWEYRTGHIPDSINFSFEPTRWSRLKNRRALAKALGADTARPLVFY